MSPNLGTFFHRQAAQYGSANAFAQKENGQFRFWTYQQLFHDILGASEWLLTQGFSKDARIAFMGQRSYARLVLELACMSCGFSSVPIFEGASAQVKSELLEQVAPSFLVVDSKDDIKFLKAGIQTICLNDWLLPQLKGNEQEIALLLAQVDSKDTATIIYTSGTTGMPKGVMLSHENILFQHRAHQKVWRLKPSLRFLSHLPWHHVYGSLFERFLCFETGGCLNLDDSLGRDIQVLIQNFVELKPHFLFSVPLVLEKIMTQLMNDLKSEKDFFHSDLRFIFSAAAPLDKKCQHYFLNKKIPVVQGWGLTETSPSSTLTPVSLNVSDTVGVALPGVEIKIQDDGEIAVRGPNVMKGYFKDEAATKRVMTVDGWFLTGDTGEIRSDGLKLLARKDRIFKLANGQKINPQHLEEKIKAALPQLKYVHVYGTYAPCAILLSEVADYFQNDEIIKLVSTAFTKINATIEVKYQRIARVAWTHAELTTENSGLTPSLKLNHKHLPILFNKMIDRLDTVDSSEFFEGAVLINLQ